MKLFVSGLLVCFSLQVLAGYGPSVGETAARHFDFQLKTSKNQKDLIHRLYGETNSETAAASFLRNTKTEGVSLPKSTAHGTVLALQGQYPVQIDFAKIESGHILIQKVEIDLTKNPNLEDIYRQIKAAKKTASSFWISQAYAEDSNGNVSLGSLIADVAKVFITKDSDANSAQASSKETKIPRQMKHLLKGYGEGPLSDFSCDPKMHALTKIETTNGDQSTVIQMQTEGNHLKAERKTGSQTCTVKTLGLNGDPGYGNPSAPWVCGKTPVSEKDLFPAYYAEELNVCCQDESCEKELHQHLAREKTGSNHSSNSKTSSKGVH